jgi:alpha-ketoglutarate-dependent taurine dioxygenase
MSLSTFTFSEQQLLPGLPPFPGGMRLDDASSTLQQVTTWVRNNTEHVNELLFLHSALLFRGLPISCAADFNEFLHSFQGYDFSENLYVGGGGPRNKILGPIHTSTESPPDFMIPMHHELAYLSHYPSKLFFYCDVEPAADGETPILLSHRIVSRLEAERPDFIAKLREKKIRYTRYISDRSACSNQYQKSWQDVFFTEDRKEAEERARLSGHDQIEWQADNSMKVVSRPMEALRWEEKSLTTTHSHHEGEQKIGRWTWFNSMVLLHPASYSDDPSKRGNWMTSYADGTPINDEDVHYVKRVMAEEKTQYKWKKGDVLLIDNFQALHSRNTFTPPRRILAAMVN